MMARYDRIAAVPLPPAAETFDGWLALRDLEDRERDAELGRRLRLHFLVLRPMLRVAAHGSAVTEASLAGQVGRTREELGLLPLRDPQRAALAELLDAVQATDGEALARAALQISERCTQWEHRSAAEAYALCALQIARRDERSVVELAALGQLARVALAGGAVDEAESYARRTAALGLQLGDREAWAGAIVQLAGAAGIRSGGAAAVETLAELQVRARDWHAPEVGVIGTLAACRHMQDGGDMEGALELAWRALPGASRAAQRLALIEAMATSLGAVGLYDEADHCAALIEARATGVPERLVIRARRARIRAEAGDAAGFEERAAALKERPAALPAAARLELARGAFLIGNTVDAQRHAAAAAQIARSHLNLAQARDAAELLATLDRTAGNIVAVPRPPHTAGRVARRIAAEVLGLGETLAPSLL